jgi:hypothetical protein
MKFIENLLGIKKENKIISLEYFLGIIIAVTLWGYHLIQTGIISQEYFQKCIHDYNCVNFIRW